MFESVQRSAGEWSSHAEQELCARLRETVPTIDRIDVPVRLAAWRLPGPELPQRPRRVSVRIVDPLLGHGATPRSEAIGDGVLPQFGTLARLLADGADALGRARDADRALGRAAAARARALATFARQRPASLIDRVPGEVGAASAATRAARPAALTAVSEWAADELAGTFSLAPHAATALLVDSLVLVEQLPATLDALERGRIGWKHTRVLVELLAPVSDDVRGEIEAKLLARLGSKSPQQLRVAARRLIARLDAKRAADRLAEEIRSRQVRLHSGKDGVSTLAALFPTPVARAAHDALERYAEACRTEGDERTKDQRMADCLADLILRPDADRPPVQAQLTVVALVETLLGGDEPGEVDGDPVPAPMVRELAYALGLLPRPSTGDPAAGDPAADAQQGALGDLLSTSRVTGTALSERPRIAVADALTGELVALTDAAGIRRAVKAGQGLGPPPETPGYRPGAELDRFVRLRDRRCRFPGCRARPRRCDLDHTRPYPHGPTAHGNLCCLCEHHHRLSHQAPGWSLWATEDGGLAWRLPSGEVITTSPPRFGADDDLPPPTAEPAGRERTTLRERICGRPRPADPAADPADDPAPF